MSGKPLLGLVLAAAFGAAEADTLLLDGVEMAASSQQQRPARGETKDRVEQRFGAPTERVAEVGDPPISRWVYPGFTVYFEYDHVVHAVPNR
ncbi:MAG: hypothetical protein R3305_10905 [Gammaproteobacteria bacterium]|nr:hypothetical protein [Gammaproteobacteria bacterium]